MAPKDNLFCRELDIDLVSETLQLYQKIEGDVNSVVWDASIVLAKYLEKQCETNTDFFKNCEVLELGSGLGCVGLTAACLGAMVTLTDLPEALPLLNFNIDENKSKWQSKGNVKSLALCWGQHECLDLKPDKILLADCIYYEESIEPLVQTLKQLSNLKTEIILCQELRDSETQKGNWKKFLKLIANVFEIYEVPLDQQHQVYRSPDITLLKITNRK